jgi:hypothetical protein
MEHPERYGFCSFEDFRKNKEKWKFSADRLFEAVQGAGTAHKQRLKKLRFEINGHRAESLEQVQRIAKEEGLSLETLDIWPEIIDLGGQWCDILVKFMSREAVKARMDEIAAVKRMEALA